MFVTLERFKIINLTLIGTCSRMVRSDKSQVDIKQNLKKRRMDKDGFTFRNQVLLPYDTLRI